MVDETNSIVSCECDHLTNFGVLVVSLYKIALKKADFMIILLCYRTYAHFKVAVSSIGLNNLLWRQSLSQGQSFQPLVLSSPSSLCWASGKY